MRDILIWIDNIIYNGLILTNSFALIYIEIQIRWSSLEYYRFKLIEILVHWLIFFFFFSSWCQLNLIVELEWFHLIIEWYIITLKFKLYLLYIWQSGKVSAYSDFIVSLLCLSGRFGQTGLSYRPWFKKES